MTLTNVSILQYTCTECTCHSSMTKEYTYDYANQLKGCQKEIHIRLHKALAVPTVR